MAAIGVLVSVLIAILGLCLLLMPLVNLVRAMNEFACAQMKVTHFFWIAGAFGLVLLCHLMWAFIWPGANAQKMGGIVFTLQLLAIACAGRGLSLAEHERPKLLGCGEHQVGATELVSRKPGPQYHRGIQLWSSGILGMWFSIAVLSGWTQLAQYIQASFCGIM